MIKHPYVRQSLGEQRLSLSFGLLLIVTCSVLVACSSTQVWVHARGQVSRDQIALKCKQDPAYRIDSNVNRQEATLQALMRKASRVDENLFASCMNANGWFQVPQNDQKLQEACDRGIGGACQMLGRVSLFGKNKRQQDPALGAKMMVKACQANVSDSCQLAGLIYESGILGVAPDAKLSFMMFRQACKLGNSGGCRKVGDNYRKRMITPKSLALAFKFYNRSCALDNRVGCHLAGMFHRHGMGTKVDAVKAKTAFRKACRLGAKVSCHEL